MKIKQKRKGKTLRATNNKPPAMVMVHLLVTRASGDVERYKLASLPDLRFAIEYRKVLGKVPVPKKLGKLWAIPSKREVA